MNQTRAELHSSFSKPPRLIESASTDPIRVVQEVFRCAFIEDLRDDLLPRWLRTALINENSIYSNAEHRAQLLAFYDRLIILTEAMQVISEKSKPVRNNLPELEPDEGKLPIFLTDDQIANPFQVVADFRQQFSAEYVRWELWYFLEAGVNHAGDYPAGFAPGYALMCYDYRAALQKLV